MRHRPFILALIVLAMPACTPVLRSPVTASPEQVATRDQYFKLHPDDPYRAAIQSGELRRGMSPTQVYLAWGRPFQRIKAEGEQRWIYKFREPKLGEGQPAVIAQLFFVEDQLVRWQRDRRGTDFRQRSQDAEPPRGLPEPSGGKPREP